MEGTDTSKQQPLLPPPPVNHSFVEEGEDISPITSPRQLYNNFVVESKKLWYLAGPAIFTCVCQYSLGAITQTFAGQVGTLDLAAFSIENSIIAGLSFGVMLGMGSALETLCGQAYGAGQMEMLGVYMQRSWVILLATAFVLMFLYIFALPFLLLIGQKEEISVAAGRLALWMIPQLYAYALNFPMAKFLQAQSKIMAMAWIAAAALVMHVVFSWLLMLKLGWGMAGAAVVLNASWWFIVVAQLIYIMSGTCGSTWTGFSWAAFHNLGSFLRLSIASAVMLCYFRSFIFGVRRVALLFVVLTSLSVFSLETWYFMALILFAGYLKNAEIAVDALSICTNILGWTITVAIGLNAAISVRVSNELGAGHPRRAKFSVFVVVVSAFFIGLSISILLLVFQNQYPSLFTNSEQVKQVVYQLTPLLAFCLIANAIQPALSGVAIGAGWQALVAYVNIACYYIFGIPLGLILGYALDLGVQGIWYGMVTGTVVQTLVLFYIVYRTNWDKEASVAAERIKMWGGGQEPNQNAQANGV